MDKAVLIYLAFIGFVALLLTAYDKWAARKRPSGRIPERTLLTVAVLGGALPMYLLMQLIRHKTRHKLFMIGLPVLIFIQTAVLLYFKAAVFV